MSVVQALLATLSQGTAAFPTPSTPDEFDFLLHLNSQISTDQWHDDSGHERAVRGFGGNTLDTSVYKFGGDEGNGSALMQAGYLRVNCSSFGLNDFTLCGWFNWHFGVDDGGSVGIFTLSPSGLPSLRLDRDNNYALTYNDGTQDVIVADTIPQDEWVFIAIERINNTIVVSVNGQYVGAATTYVGIPTAQVLVGFPVGGNVELSDTTYFHGRIDEVMLQIGAAYFGGAATFSVPTGEFTSPTAATIASPPPPPLDAGGVKARRPATVSIGISGKAPTPVVSFSSGPFVVDVGRGAIAYTGKAPAPLYGVPVSFAPTPRTISYAGFAPSLSITLVSSSPTAFPAAKQISLTKFAPTVVVSTVAPSMTVSPGAGALNISKFAPSTMGPSVVTPSFGVLGYTTYAPTATTTNVAPSVSPSFGSIGLTTFAPTRSVAVTSPTFVPGAATATLTGLAPTAAIINNSVTSTPAAGTVTYAGQVPVFALDGPATLAPAAGSIGATGGGAPIVATYDPTLGDPYYGDVQLLLHFDGSNGQTSFQDTSPYRGTQHLAGSNFDVFNGTKKFGSGSLQVASDSAANYLQYTPGSGASFAMGSGDFTWEGWFYSTDLTGTHTMIGSRIAGNAGPLIQTVGTQIEAYTYGSGGVIGDVIGGTVTANVWNHFAYVRTGSQFRLYLNGVTVGFANSSDTAVAADSVVIGTDTAVSGHSYAGFLDEIRITKRIARYTSAFTPPTSAFSETGPNLFNIDPTFIAYSTFAPTVSVSTQTPVTVTPAAGAVALTGLAPTAIADIASPTFAPGVGTVGVTGLAPIATVSTSIYRLLHLDGSNGSTTFTDELGSTVTPTNSPSLSTTQSKFGGASLHLTGTANLNVPVGTIAGDFTLCAWFYWDGTGGNNCVLALGPIDWEVYIQGSSAAMGFWDGSATQIFTASNSVVANTWQFVALERVGSAITLSVDGTAVGGFSDGSSLSTTSMLIGSEYGIADRYHGYIDEVMMTNGTAYFGGTSFTNPTTAFSASAGPTNTSITPAAGSVANTGLAPTLTVSGGATISPAAGSVAVTGQAPTATATTAATVAPGAGSVAYSTAAPTATVANNASASPAAGSVALTGLAPTIAVTATTAVAPSAGSVALTGQAPDFTIASPPTGDAFYDNVVFLFHADGSNGSTTFTDSSKFGATITQSASGFALSTAQSKFGGSSLLCASTGTSDYLNVAPGSGSTFSMGSGDWTWEGWFYPTSLGGGLQMLVGSGSPFDLGPFIAANNSALRGILFSVSGVVGDISAGSLSNNTWYHWAYVRSGSNFELFLNGTSIGTSSSSSASADITNIQIGVDPANGRVFQGYQDEIRITKGVARYTANFTPPSAAFPDFGAASDVVAAPGAGSITYSPFAPAVVIAGPATLYRLLHLDGSNGSTTFTEESGAIVTPTGSPTISTTQSKFGGASLALPGSASLSVAISTVATDFTIGCWFYWDGTSGNQGVISFGPIDWEVFIRPSSTTLELWVAGAGNVIVSASSAVTANTWMFACLERVGSNVVMSLNGVQVGSTYTNGASLSATALVVGAEFNNAESFHGYIDEAFMSNGVAYFGGSLSFTPPAVALSQSFNFNVALGVGSIGYSTFAPAFTASAGYEVLMHMDGTNGATTYTEEGGKTATGSGTVALSTTQQKFGSASALFGGGHISVPIGTFAGDYTVCAWFYCTSASGNPTIFGVGSASLDDLQVFLRDNSSGALTLSIGGTPNVIGPSPVSTNTWHFACLERVGTTLYLSLDGTVFASTASLSGSKAYDTFIIGDSYSVNSHFTGYIDEVAIQLGIAKFASNTGSFTPPSAAF